MAPRDLIFELDGIWILAPRVLEKSVNLRDKIVFSTVGVPDVYEIIRSYEGEPHKAKEDSLVSVAMALEETVREDDPRAKRFKFVGIPSELDDFLEDISEVSEDEDPHQNVEGKEPADDKRKEEGVQNRKSILDELD